MAHKTKINGTAYEINGGTTKVGGTKYSISKGRTKVGGTGYDISFSVPISDLAVGSSVYLNVNGVRTEFLIVHQGLPSSLYHSSCDGTWLVMKNIYTELLWDSTNSDYANSDIHAYLTGTLLGLLDSNIKNAINTARIPYVKGSGKSGSVSSGSSGLSTKVFLLSGYEVGFTNSVDSAFPVDGAKLSYFASGDTANGTNRIKRIAKLNNKASAWWLRSASKTDDKGAMGVDGIGSFGDWYVYDEPAGVRPAIIMNSETLVSQSDYSVIGL